MTESSHLSPPAFAPGPLGAPATTTPLAAGRLTTWLELARVNRGRIDAPFAARAAFATLSSAALAPLRTVHRLRLGRALDRVGAMQDPILILGHYRSGTTHLQNLLTHDPQWGMMSTAQALAPELALAPGPWKRALAALLPPTRAMDEMEMGVDLPEEPDHALGAVSMFSFYHGFAFPRSFAHHYRHNVAMEGRSPRTIRRWAELYRDQLRLACALTDRRRVVVKNPADTARLSHVVDAFPDGRFIFVVRNPRTMFFSIRNFYRKTLEEFSMQRWTESELEALVWDTYEHMLGAYLRDREAVPAGRLVEVRFEEMEAQPLAVLERIYETLGLPGFPEAARHFCRYLGETEGYRKNAYSMEPHLVAKIEERWRFAFEAWGYD